VRPSTLSASQRLYASSLVNMVRVEDLRLRDMSRRATVWVSSRSGGELMMDDDADGWMSTASQEEGRQGRSHRLARSSGR
jgi:hypothetical protein